MNILAIETSTDACSCALWLSGEISERFVFSPRRHGELILAMIDGLLAESKLRLQALDGLVFGYGPGSFTGLRIGAGVIQGLAFALELPVALISSLAALAQGVNSERVVTIQDARMGEVYYGAFCRGSDLLMETVVKERLCRPELIIPPQDTGQWVGVGNGWEIYQMSLMECEITILPGVFYPHARDVAILGAEQLIAGQGISAGDAIPIYLRDQIPTQ